MIESYAEEEIVGLDPDWLCHILTEDWTGHLCGAPGAEEGPTCQEYDGEAICPTCCKPTCPHCAQIAALDDALDDS